MEDPLPFVPFEAVDHTADLAFIARGRTPEELFLHAAQAVAAFTCDPRSVAARDEESFEVEGTDPEELLVSWLQEILYRHEVHHRLYCGFRVDSVTPTRLVGRGWGEAYAPARHDILAGIKAATYHDLAIREEMTADGPLFWVRVVLDT